MEKSSSAPAVPPRRRRSSRTPSDELSAPPQRPPPGPPDETAPPAAAIPTTTRPVPRERHRPLSMTSATDLLGSLSQESVSSAAVEHVEQDSVGAAVATAESSVAAAAGASPDNSPKRAQRRRLFNRKPSNQADRSGDHRTGERDGNDNGTADATVNAHRQRPLSLDVGVLVGLGNREGTPSPPPSPLHSSPTRASSGSGKSRRGFFRRRGASCEEEDKTRERTEGLRADSHNSNGNGSRAAVRPVSPHIGKRLFGGGSRKGSGKRETASVDSETSEPLATPPSAASGVTGQTAPSPLSPLSGLPLRPALPVAKASVFTLIDGELDVHMSMHPQVPLVVRACIDYLSQSRALREEGLFRVSGNKTEILQLDASLREEEEELPVDAKSARRLFKAVELSTAPEQQLRRMRRVFSSLSPMRLSVARSLLHLFRKIIAQDGNLMTSANLGTAVGTTIFPGLAIQKCALILDYAVLHYHDIFRDLVSEAGLGDQGEDADKSWDASASLPLPSAASKRSASDSQAVEPERLSRLTAMLNSSSLSEPPAPAGVMRF